jgi:hypothetical protein
MMMSMTALWAALATAFLFAGPAIAGCAGEKIAEYKRMSPLLGATDDTALVVSVHASGCIATRFPSHYRNPGVVSWLVPSGELKRLEAEIAASGVAGIDVALLQAEVTQAKRSHAKSGSRLYLVSDDDIVQFELRSNAKSAAPVIVRWHGLQNDLLNTPTQSELLRMSALQQKFLEISDDAQTRKALGRTEIMQ